MQGFPTSPVGAASGLMGLEGGSESTHGVSTCLRV